jgi:hypothetical protein
MTMTDEQLSGLFAEGTAPESDPAFALKVAAGIGRERFRLRLLAFAPRAAMTLAVAATALVAAGLVKFMLLPLVDGAPQFMGVPAPVVLGVVVAGLALGIGRYVFAPDSGVRLLELAE